MMREWHVAAGLEPVISLASLKEMLLRERGLGLEAHEAFFAPKYERDIHDPLSLYDMPAALDRIFSAIKEGERILIYGDYDVDGVTSTAILVTVLRDLGAHVSPFIPHRTDDGYGLNLNVLQRLAGEFDVLIAVDCGITATAEAAWLKSAGKDVIIIDHHTVPDELPDATAIIHARHPQSPYACGGLCGAGAAWKTASALARDRRSSLKDNPDYEKWLLDLAMLGTLGDSVPLLGENRAIVKFGLEILRRTKRVGLACLIESLHLDRGRLSIMDAVFKIIPRLNAAGRMLHAQPALDLLLTDNEARAAKLLADINALNSLRQTITKKIMVEAEQQVAAASGEVIFAYSEGWPTGVTGLVANRLVEKFSRPAIVIGGRGEFATGSARGPASVNVLALLKQSESLLVRLGGHLQAAGFTISVDRIDNFRSKVLELAGQEKTRTASEGADLVMDHALLKNHTARLLHDFEPFGEGNETPTFVWRNLPLADCRTVGKSADHAKLTFWVDEEAVDGIGFGLGAQLPQGGQGRILMDVLGELEENEFRGRTRLQINIKDFAPAGSVKIVGGKPV